MVLLLVGAVQYGHAQTLIGGNERPHQYSTHTYTVTMWDAGDQTVWRIFSGTLTSTDVESGTYTPLVRNTSYKVETDLPVSGTATFKVKFIGAMAPGPYTIVYKELKSYADNDGDDCATTIVKNIEIVNPIDIMVELNNTNENICPEATGDDELNTTTDVEFKVKLNFPNYAATPTPDKYAGAHWYFRYTITVTGNGGTSATIKSVTQDSNTINGNVAASTYTNVCTISNDDSEVDFTVVLNDQLGVEQNVAVVISEVEGSYLEAETNMTNNSQTITIYSMPNISSITALN